MYYSRILFYAISFLKQTGSCQEQYFVGSFVKTTTQLTNTRHFRHGTISVLNSNDIVSFLAGMFLRYRLYSIRGTFLNCYERPFLQDYTMDDRMDDSIQWKAPGRKGPFRSFMQVLPDKTLHSHIFIKSRSLENQQTVRLVWDVRIHIL